MGRAGACCVGNAATAGAPATTGSLLCGAQQTVRTTAPTVVFLDISRTLITLVRPGCSHRMATPAAATVVAMRCFVQVSKVLVVETSGAYAHGREHRLEKALLRGKMIHVFSPYRFCDLFAKRSFSPVSVFKIFIII